jgi:hypothetical protein
MSNDPSPKRQRLTSSQEEDVNNLLKSWESDGLPNEISLREQAFIEWIEEEIDWVNQGHRVTLEDLEKFEAHMAAVKVGISLKAVRRLRVLWYEWLEARERRKTRCFKTNPMTDDAACRWWVRRYVTPEERNGPWKEMWEKYYGRFF